MRKIKSCKFQHGFKVIQCCFNRHNLHTFETLLNREVLTTCDARCVEERLPFRATGNRFTTVLPSFTAPRLRNVLVSSLFPVLRSGLDKEHVLLRFHGSLGMLDFTLLVTVSREDDAGVRRIRVDVCVLALAVGTFVTAAVFELHKESVTFRLSFSK